MGPNDDSEEADGSGTDDGPETRDGSEPNDGPERGDDPPPVHRTYDRIAEHFAATREYPWPEVESFLADRRGRTGLDVGCGNGRHAELLADRAARVVGLDASRELLRAARERAADRGFAIEAVQGDAGALPLPADSVDLAVYVATLHHLRPRDRRVASLDELARVLAPGGRALVSAWSTEHDRFEDGPEGGGDGGDGDDSSDGGDGKDGSDGSDRNVGFDAAIDWTLPGGETVPRYYHVYAPAEFDADLDRSALRTVEAFVSSGNCYAVVAAPED